MMEESLKQVWTIGEQELFNLVNLDICCILLLIFRL